MKFGRKRPVANAPTLRLSKYLRATLPAPPSTLDLTPPALVALRDVMQNDVLGDCVIACGGHLVATLTGNGGSLFHATPAEITTQYEKIGGYVPGDPSTDQGCNISTALSYWTANGLTDGTKLLGSLSVDPTNEAELKAAMWLFENLVFGIELPDAWVNPFPSGDGFVWDVGTPDENNGHCVCGVGYSSKGILIDSWGLFGTLTYAAIAKLCAAADNGEVHVTISTDLLIKGQTRAPNGLDWSSLIADFDSIGGTVPVPAPTPAPAPAPAPSPSPTPATSVSLAQVESWLAAGINSGAVLQTRSQAIKLANAQLSKNWPKS
jgi:hypothetical protein